MNQLTLRGLDKELEQRIRRLAKKERTSLNKAALRLMRHGAALDPVVAELRQIGNRLDDFIGSWSAVQAAEFDKSIEIFEEIDQEQWQ